MKDQFSLESRSDSKGRGQFYVFVQNLELLHKHKNVGMAGT